MTRVNLLDPDMLSDQHLIAERLELTWVLISAKRSLKSKLGLKVSPKYILGVGHVSFFHDKLGYIRQRFYDLTEEMKVRHMRPIMPWPDDSWVPSYMMKTYNPTQEAIDLIKKLIKERLLIKLSWYRYYGKPITEAWLEDVYD